MGIVRFTGGTLGSPAGWWVHRRPVNPPTFCKFTGAMVCSPALCFLSRRVFLTFTSQWNSRFSRRVKTCDSEKCRRWNQHFFKCIHSSHSKHGKIIPMEISLRRAHHTKNIMILFDVFVRVDFILLHNASWLTLILQLGMMCVFLTTKLGIP